MKLFEISTVTRVFLFAVLIFLAADMLRYAYKEWMRISKLKKTGTVVPGTFTNISVAMEKRKLKISADLTYKDPEGNDVTFTWSKGFFDEEVLLFRNADKKKLPVHVHYDPEVPMNMYIEECYSPKKHKVIIALCVLAVVMFAYSLFVL